MELQYANPEMVYCRPVGEREICPEALECDVVHVPPLAGMKTEEERRDRGAQDLAIGEGRPGEVLRNLLFEVSQRRENWETLVSHVENMFQVRLLKPEYAPKQPFIISEYLPGLPPRGRGGLRPLDIATGGSGFHQVLLLLAFFYARPGSVLLLDEPDAHLHVILQREVHDLLRRVARERGSQLIISTHSEIILSETDFSQMVAFVGPHPHLLASTSDKAQLRKALTRLTSLDLLLAEERRAIFFAEGQTDLKILREWARVLNHRALPDLEHAFFKPLGTDRPTTARAIFFALRSAYPTLRGLCLLDRPTQADHEDQIEENGLTIARWQRREIENYLLVPSAMVRYCGGETGDLVEESKARELEKSLRDSLPPVVFSEPFGDNPTLMTTKASDDILLPMFKKHGRLTNKGDLFLVAAQMTREEIHPEIEEKLDLIADILGEGSR